MLECILCPVLLFLKPDPKSQAKILSNLQFFAYWYPVEFSVLHKAQSLWTVYFAHAQLAKLHPLIPASREHAACLWLSPSTSITAISPAGGYGGSGGARQRAELHGHCHGAH